MWLFKSWLYKRSIKAIPIAWYYTASVINSYCYVYIQALGKEIITCSLSLISCLYFEFIENSKLTIDAQLNRFVLEFFHPVYRKYLKKRYSVWDHMSHKHKIKYPSTLLAVLRVFVFDVQMLIIKWLNRSFSSVVPWSMKVDAQRACWMYRQPWKLQCVPAYSHLTPSYLLLRSRSIRRSIITSAKRSDILR